MSPKETKEEVRLGTGIGEKGLGESMNVHLYVSGCLEADTSGPISTALWAHLYAYLYVCALV